MELRTTPLVRYDAGRLMQPSDIEGRSNQGQHHIRIRNRIADHLRIKGTAADTSCVDEGFVTRAPYCIPNSVSCEKIKALNSINGTLAVLHTQ